MCISCDNSDYIVIGWWGYFFLCKWGVFIVYIGIINNIFI